MSSSSGLRERRTSSTTKAATTTRNNDETPTQAPAPTSTTPSQQHVLLEDEGVTLTPLRQRSWWMRLDVFPFIALYGACVWLERHVTELFPTLLRTLVFPSLLLVHLSLVIWQQWRVQVACRVGYVVEKCVNKWTHCLVEDKQEAGLEVVQRPSHSVVVVNFQDTIFRYETSTQEATLWKQQSESPVHTFHRLHYPVDLHMDFYKDWLGHVSLDSIRQASAMYGPNTTNIELPSFLHLLGEQLLAPFFLFQLFCVVLWSLDEYWYYAIFTLVALVFFESTVAYNRLQSLQRLRSSMRHGQHLYAYRVNKWMVVRSEELVPGDIVSLSRSGLHIPADILLTKGTAVVDEALLTGESVPQIKAPLEETTSRDETNLNLQEHRQSVLFGGTVLVSHSLPMDESSTDSIPKPPPDGGVVGMVLKTGFETAQGSLLRTMAHSSKKSADGIHTTDTFVFVGILLLCAIFSALLVLQQGWHDDTRNRFRLVLHVIIIITSVVPPELPMELSLAVTNSVADLMRRSRVFCTEPFRIPWAGMVEICCFDKTGTLTSDEMQFQGVDLLSDDDVLKSSSELPWETVRVMAGCHSLAWSSGGSRDKCSTTAAVIGDPLEAAVLRDTGFHVQRNDTVMGSFQETSKTLHIQHRFAFSSRLKRMTVLVTEDGDKSPIWALTKGAPETIEKLLKTVPDNYEQVYTHHMGCGQRVLAMGYRKLDNTNVADLKEKGREFVEQDLIFCGFLVLDCPLKSDTKSVITELRKSGHSVVMITGDAVLTGAEVARQTGIIRKKTKVTYELRERPASGVAKTLSADPMSDFVFVPLTARKSKTLESATIVSACDFSILQEMISNNEGAFCVSGAMVTAVATAAVKLSPTDSKTTIPTDEKTVLFHPAAQNVLKVLVPLISVFARHAPRQKEAVVAAFNLSGRHTLMCGDGTNDVGALKRAHVGISIISAPELEAKQREAKATLAKVKGQKRKKSKASSRTMSSFEASLRKLQEAQEELDHVELGDASVASPFTSRAMSIKCCKDVLQQGRCTLVTMLQIYKILGVNCLVNALVLTKLHMHGVKQGDRQLTILGVAVAALFLFVTRGKPLPTLSPHRPPSSVLCAQALLSIAAQFAVHMCAILVATEAALAFVDPYDPSIIPDGSFNPNVLNTCTFLLTMVATINTFMVNYKGRPFMEDFHENKLLLRSVQVCHAVVWICALEAFPPLNDLLQLSAFPNTDMSFAADDDWVASVAQAGGLTQVVRTLGFPTFMCLLMAADTVIAYSVEKLIGRLFDS